MFEESCILHRNHGEARECLALARAELQSSLHHSRAVLLCTQYNYPALLFLLLCLLGTLIDPDRALLNIMRYTSRSLIFHSWHITRDLMQDTYYQVTSEPFLEPIYNLYVPCIWSLLGMLMLTRWLQAVFWRSNSPLSVSKVCQSFVHVKPRLVR